MKDALVASTRKASLSEGHGIGFTEGHAEGIKDEKISALELAKDPPKGAST
jgi:hypothetical protein